MSNQLYLFSKGNGNDGDYERFIVELGDKDCPYAALPALVANEYIAGRAVRRHIIRTLEVGGEAEYGLHAMATEGPHGEMDMGAAWLTAKLVPIASADDVTMQSASMSYPIRSILDPSALRQYRAALKAKRAWEAEPHIRIA